MLHHARSGYVHRAFLSSRRAQDFADFHGDDLSRSVAAQHGALAGERGSHRPDWRAVALDRRRGDINGGFLDRREPARRHTLALARYTGCSSRNRVGIFQYAVPGGDDRLAAERELGNGDRHYQRHLRPRPYARDIAQRDFSDFGVPILFRHPGNDAEPGRHASLRRVDERDVSVRFGNQSHPIADFDEDEKDHWILKLISTLPVDDVFQGAAFQVANQVFTE